MNLDAIWSKEPSTMVTNPRMISLLISTCETSGFDPYFPILGPFSFEDLLGFIVAFIMLIHSLLPSRQSSKYTHVFTILNQRSSYNNAHLSSQKNDKSGMNM